MREEFTSLRYQMKNRLTFSGFDLLYILALIYEMRKRLSDKIQEKES